MSKQILTEIINPALARLAAHRIPVSDAARVMLYAIGLQESNLQHRFQISLRSNGERFRGPARGLWQFEKGGGVSGVVNHRSSADIARVFTAEFVAATPRITAQSGQLWPMRTFWPQFSPGFCCGLTPGRCPRLRPPVSGRPGTTTSGSGGRASRTPRNGPPAGEPRWTLSSNL